MSAIAHFVGAPATFSARYPQWWVAALSVIAWVILLGIGWEKGLSVHHTHHSSFSALFGHWLLMVAAMMLPLTLEAARITAVRSFWYRRHRAIAAFLVGYLCVWGLIGAVASPLRTNGMLAGLVLAAAATWQVTAMKRRMLRGCHLTIPLAPRGWRADVACMRYGRLVGIRCAGNCGLLMLACAASGHSLVLMICATAIGVVERARPGSAYALAASLLFLSVAFVTGLVH